MTRIKLKVLTGVAVAGLLTTACTTQIATRPDLTRTKAANFAMTGIPYNLPMLQYRIDVTRTLSSCPSIQKKTDGSVLFFDPGLTIDVKVEATPRYVRGETYVVDYRSLQNMFKQTSLGITNYETNGNLKTINTSADDKTGDVLKDVAKVGLTVAAVAGGGPAAGLAVGAALSQIDKDSAGGGANGKTKSMEKVQRDNAKAREQAAQKARQIADEELLAPVVDQAVDTMNVVACAPATVAAIAARKQATKTVEDTTKTLEDANADVEQLKLLIAVRGLSEVAKAAYAARFDKALVAQRAALVASAKASEAKTKIVSALVDVSTHVWPERLDQFDGTLAVKAPTLKSFGAALLIVQNQKRVINFQKFAALLVKFRKSNPAAFERLADHYGLGKFLNANGEAAAQQNVVAACEPGANPSIISCLSDSLRLAARLHTVERSRGRLVEAGCTKTGDEDTSQFPSLDCRMEVTGADTVDARGSTTGGAPVSNGGVFVRQPVEGALFVCGKDVCDPNGDDNLFAVDAKAAPTIAPQLGQLRFLPFRNTSFQSNELTLELAVDGSITKFQYQDKAARAAVAAATAGDIVKQIDDDRTKRRDEQAKARTQSVTDLQAQIDTLEKQAKLLELQTPKSAAQTLAASTIVDLNAETARLNAKLSKQDTINKLLAAGGTLD